MRILFISNLYPPYDLGGMEQLCQEVVEHLRARGHVCHVLTSLYGVAEPHPVEEGITRALHLEVDVNYYRPLDFFLRRSRQERANQRALRDVMDSFQPDIIFIWGMWNLSWQVAYCAEQWLPNRVAYNIASYWPVDIDPHTGYWKEPAKRIHMRVLKWPLARLAHGILRAQGYPPPLQFAHVSCCSQHVVDVLVKAGAVPLGAVAILNGIDPLPFVSRARPERKPSHSLNLLYFGGLMEHKGVHTAIEALGLLQQRGQADGLTLTVVGGGHPQYESRLRAMIESLSLEDRVHFVGRVQRAQIPEILPCYDVFLFTSIWAEPFGRTIVEAMAAGLVVIGADVGGSREIFEHYPADLLFPPGNAAALAQQIQRLIDDPDLVQLLKQLGPALVMERFTLDRMVDETEAWLKEIAG